METIVFGEVTVQDLLIYAGVAVAGLVGLGVVMRLLRRSEPSRHHQLVRCRCGWQGQVSRAAGRCPRCNQPLGEQRARGGS